jgi:hypothetical protein
MDCTCVYTTVHCCTTWHYLNIRLCTHYSRIRYTTVRLYCSQFSVHSGPVILCIQLHCTTVRALVPAWPLFCQPRRALIDLLCSYWSIRHCPLLAPSLHLNCCMLTTSFPKGNGRGKITKGHSLFLTPIRSVYTLHFVFASAHTLFRPFILMLRPVDHTLCLD